MRGAGIRLLFLILFPGIAFSQIRTLKPYSGGGYWGGSFETGVTSFFGDIDEGPAEGGIFKNNLAFKLKATRDFNSVFEISGRLTYGKMSGIKIRGVNTSTTYIYFQNKFTEYTIDFVVNFVAFLSKNENQHFLVLGSVGLGLIDFQTTLYNGIDNTIIRSYGKGEEKATTEFVLPLGIELRYHLNSRSAIFMQTTSSRVDTDKLDGMPGNNNRDYYNFSSIGYTYKIPMSTKQKRLIQKRK
ncbi:MAG: hypothetical protein K9G76_09740 [Bacteroidales bacterium]|nr:hypothetical protein [Bacteroidales bacterium]MCF8403980.1 hypothetical protein [Bacteroidales bacterium]